MFRHLKAISPSSPASDGVPCPRVQGSDVDWRSGSASDTALGRFPPPVAPASQQRQVEALRRRYQRQQDKLRRLEQTNYVSAAVWQNCPGGRWEITAENGGLEVNRMIVV